MDPKHGSSPYDGKWLANRNLRVIDFIDNNLKTWKVNLVKDAFDPSNVEQILQISISTISNQDRLIWSYSRSDNYLLLLNSLPIRELLFSKLRKMHLSPNCGELESVVHLFFLCPLVQAVWFSSFLTLRSASLTRAIILDYWTDMVQIYQRQNKKEEARAPSKIVRLASLQEMEYLFAMSIVGSGFGPSSNENPITPYFQPPLQLWHLGMPFVWPYLGVNRKLCLKEMQKL
ncbi:conserved hypothetical protein [Ricinus communis]|uniref:Reverse transcriptase zinc-binding domain-containing protein n=1 Tax=Ricinus communis TaxID=3988 RepID=B9RX00_RICCO|nr:conserved hypothetical protein [Ricinus communis]